MKKIYFIYAIIPDRIYNERIKYLISNKLDFKWKNGKLFGLYAWTTKKKLIDEFFEVRPKNIYSITIKEDIDKKYYEDYLLGSFSSMELKQREYTVIDDNSTKSVYIVSTKDEWLASTKFGEENVYEQSDIYNFKIRFSFPLTTLNDKLYRALDILGYIDEYVLSSNDNDEIDFLNFNLSFNLGYTGREATHRTLTKDTLSILLFLFHYMFYGKERGVNNK